MITQEILYNLYLIECFSISQIMEKLNISRYKIEKLLKQFGIQKKTMSETLKSPKIQEQIKLTNLKKYDSEYYMGSPDFIQKSKQSKKYRYGNEIDNMDDIDRTVCQAVLDNFNEL